MKNATKFCIITIVIGMLLAFTIFTLFANGLLSLDTSSPFFILLILFAGALLVSLLIGSLSAKNEPRLREAYSCCGNLATTGGTCLILAAFLTSLSPVFNGVLFALGIAICFFFLVLLLGGILCFLHAYFSFRPVSCPSTSAPGQTYSRPGYEDLPLGDEIGRSRRPIL